MCPSVQWMEELDMDTFQRQSLEIRKSCVSGAEKVCGFISSSQVKLKLSLR